MLGWLRKTTFLHVSISLHLPTVQNMKLSLVQQFGRRIRELRVAAGMSQATFAAKCAYTRPYISNIERGLANPSLDFVEVIAGALKIEVKELFETSVIAIASAKVKPKDIMVPFAKDGSCFNPTLRRPKVGTYTVGELDNEKTFDTFDAALGYLKVMKTAYWRRPSKAGNFGRVVAVRWDKLPKKYWTT